jgi:hypothetical protein
MKSQDIEKQIKQECSFKPHINKNSIEIVDKLEKGIRQNFNTFQSREDFYNSKKEAKLKMVQKEMDKQLTLKPATFENHKKKLKQEKDKFMLQSLANSVELQKKYQ